MHLLNENQFFKMLSEYLFSMLKLHNLDQELAD